MNRTFEEIARIPDDMARNEEIYQFFNEEMRLQGRTGSVEFETTFSVIQSLLAPQSHILDMGAGTGVYAVPLSQAGHKVCAWEPASRNFAQLQEKAAELYMQIRQASSLNMADLPDKSFDMVLLLGPLYHLDSKADQNFTLQEAKRVCKKGGNILISFINHDMVPMTETGYDTEWFAHGDYDKERLRLHNRPFIFFRLDEAKALLQENGLAIQRIIASDGFAELLAPQLHQMSEEAYANYRRWHAARCEDVHLLGASNHWLFVCKASE